MLSPLNTVEKSCSLGERMSRYEQGIGLLSASFLFPEPLMHCFWHLFQLDSAFFIIFPNPSLSFLCFFFLRPLDSYCWRAKSSSSVAMGERTSPWRQRRVDQGEIINDMFITAIIASHSQWQAWLTLQLRIRMHLLQISPNPLASALVDNPLLHCLVYLQDSSTPLPGKARPHILSRASTPRKAALCAISRHDQGKRQWLLQGVDLVAEPGSSNPVAGYTMAGSVKTRGPQGHSCRQSPNKDTKSWSAGPAQAGLILDWNVLPSSPSAWSSIGALCTWCLHCSWRLSHDK